MRQTAMQQTEALREVDAATLKALLTEDKAVLIDVREVDEFAREHIPGARLVPLSGFNPDDFPHEHDKIGVFHCASGNRTCLAAGQLLATGFAEVRHLDGGIAGWKAAGFATNTNRRMPISVMRQVQLTAGSLILLGVLLSVLVSPWFMALSAFVGGGLVLAGASGHCQMADILAAMPWNRAFRAPEQAAG